MFKKFRKNEKGFTLAELLIVVAIIGVLVAISIPIFTAQLEKAREATDLANMRSAYAECSAAALTETAAGTTTNGITVAVDADGIVTCTKTYEYVQTVSGWVTADAKVANITPPDGGKGTAVTITVKSDGSQATITK